MRTPTLPSTEPANTESANIAYIRAPTIPVVDWRPIHGSLTAFRAGYEEIEQFVGQLLDHIDLAWQELDAERSRLAAGGRATIEAQPGTALTPISVSIDSLQRVEPLGRRITELEEDRYALQAEAEFTRTQLAEQTKQLADERCRAAEERATWADELRLLREAIHRQMEAFNSLPLMPQIAGGAGAEGSVPAGAASHAPSDPVVGSLLSQFKILQRDAARRRGLVEKRPE
jgi:hypothetical protein